MNLDELKKQIESSDLSYCLHDNEDEIVPLCLWCTDKCSPGCSDDKCSNGCSTSKCTSCPSGCHSACPSACTLCTGLLSIY